ncbi:hypothetical protein ORD22_02570 [Sporosarcina sp. GW1-11]|uniref:hypothetical protein n=1 Tax=Sporosarcina sp. GW1-11 TaxID=2899126 RepID=UPI00294FCF8C|nr:hypothetical protein [Sporosarcina sp. GW1-11]MDV6377147.1 hypothetical protein [Sporosarcina sp. GW1-11]
MDFKTLLDLEGSEFLTHFYNQSDPSFMIVATGENMDSLKEGPAVIHLYMFVDGEVNHGIESFVFPNPKRAWEFLNKLPQMSAIDFMVDSVGFPPKIQHR